MLSSNVIYIFFAYGYIYVSASRYSCRLTEYQITQTPSPQLSERAREEALAHATPSRLLAFTIAFDGKSLFAQRIHFV